MPKIWVRKKRFKILTVFSEFLFIRYDLIRSMVPENYQKVIKNIRKIEEKKKKKSNDNETNASEYDQKSR